MNSLMRYAGFRVAGAFAVTAAFAVLGGRGHTNTTNVIVGLVVLAVVVYALSNLGSFGRRR